MGIIRNTKSVRTLLDEFENQTNARSVSDLVEKFRKAMNKTTVYRILERLEDEGRLHSFIGKDGLKWYARCQECSSGHHHDVHPHFQCRNCGKTECIRMDVSIPQLPGHRIDSAELLLLGQCEACLS